MKKIMMGAACLLLAGLTAASLTACSLFTASSQPEENYPSDVASLTGGQGSAESWLAAQDTPSTYERRLYEEALADGYTGTFYEFLAECGLASEDDTAYVSRALCSVVTIETVFSVGGGRVISDGSGVIYRLDKAAGEAYIVTNYHVIANATTSGGISFGGQYVQTHGSTTDWNTITVTLCGGEQITSSRGDGTVTLMGGNNTNSDLAVLRVLDEALSGSDALAAEYADAVVGEQAYAIGNAEGEGISVTRGVVSVLSEQITISAADEWTQISFDALRTDAAINQGNSGGGLFNERGELLGIVTARLESVGTASVDGFGYAVPAADVNAVLAQLGCGSVAAAQQRAQTAAQRVLLDHTAAAQRAASSVVTVVGDEGEGSGVIYDLDKAAGEAYIVTNYHVVYAGDAPSGISSQITVYFYGDRAERNPVTAAYVGGVMEEDIAVLHIEDSSVLAASDAQEAVAADSSSLTVGEDVYAVGNAGGEGLSVTAGIVSVPGEYINVASSDDTSTLTMLGIRTDAAINHGNSGGGLFNEMGELIGIVNARSDEESIVAFGYAIPANRALLIAQNVIDNAQYSQGAVRASLGGVTVYAYRSHALYYEQTGKIYSEEQVALRSVTSGSAAAKMGLDVGDTLLSARVERGGQTVLSAAITRDDRLGELLYGVRLGDTLHLSVSRRGEVREYSYTFSSVSDFTEIL